MDQIKINELISSLKKLLNIEKNIFIPEKGLQEALQLKSIRTNFTVIVNRKGRKSPKFTLQLSSDNYKSKPLLRLDIIGPDHPNPDGDFAYAGQVIPCPHIHVAHEFFGMSIAYPLNEDYAKMYLTDQEINDLVTILQRFLKRCNVSNVDDYTIEHQIELLRKAVVFMITQLRKAFEDWNRSYLNFSPIDDFIEITTPFVDINHDFIQVFLEKTPTGTYRLSDDGHTLNELQMRGISIKNSKNRSAYFNGTLTVFGISFEKSSGELFINVPTIASLPQKQNNLLQCILRIFDMMLTARDMVTNIFFEEVENYFNESDILFTSNVGFTGKTGNQQTFDFVIPHRKEKKEKLIYIVNQPTATNYRPALFPFIDVQEARPDADFYVLANDTEKAVSPKFAEPILNYNIEIIEWSQRNKWIDQLKVI